jgi:uncharacterized membrane protein
MNQRLIISSALASVLALGLINTASAADAMGKDSAKEKCFGIAKAGANDCANLSGTHSCAGQTKMDGDIADWKYVAKGTCADMKGTSETDAKKMVKKS